MRASMSTTTLRTKQLRIGLALSAAALAALLVAPVAAHAEYETPTNVASNSTAAKRQIAMSGTRVIWVDDRSGTPQIYLYDLVTHQERQITTAAMAKLNPDIDGNRIVYLQETNIHPEMFVDRHAYSAMWYDIALGVGGTLSTGDCNEVRIFGDLARWREKLSGWNAFGYHNILTGEHQGADLQRPTSSTVRTRATTAPPRAGTTPGGQDSTLRPASTGAWVTRKSALASSPVTTTPSVLPGVYRAPLTVSLGAPGASATYYRIGAGSATLYTEPIVLSQPGQTLLSYWSENGSGVAESEHSMTLTIVNNVAPHATLTRAWTYPYSGIGEIPLPGIPATDPAGGWIGISDRSSPLKMSFESTGSAGSLTHVSVDNGAAQTFLGNVASQITIQMSGVGEGRHRIDYAASDAFSREATQSGWVNFDKWPPSTTVNQTVTGWTSGDVTFSLSATDTASGVSKTYWQLDPYFGWNPGYGDPTPTEYTGPFTITQEGYNQLAMWSVDKVGKAEGRKVVYAMIDRTPPVTTLQGGLLNGQWSTDPVFMPNSADGGSGVSQQWARVNGGPIQIIPNGYWGSAYDGTDGTKVLEYGSIDNAGNRETTKTITVKVDKTAPTIKTNAPDEWPVDEFGNYVPCLVSVNANDSGSGLSEVRYSVNSSFGGSGGAAPAGTQGRSWSSVRPTSPSPPLTSAETPPR